MPDSIATVTGLQRHTYRTKSPHLPDTKSAKYLIQLRKAGRTESGLSIRGHKVLVIDCDPQGSLTTLFGILPDAEVEAEHTILPLCLGEQESVEYAIRSTYWDGIDLIPATSVLFSAEFALPGRQRDEGQRFQFWNVLHYGIEQARQTYDVIIIDTPPALSYVTINAMMAADGIITPLPPNALNLIVFCGRHK